MNTTTTHSMRSAKSCERLSAKKTVMAKNAISILMGMPKSFTGLALADANRDISNLRIDGDNYDLFASFNPLGPIRSLCPARGGRRLPVASEAQPLEERQIQSIAACKGAMNITRHSAHHIRSRRA